MSILQTWPVPAAALLSGAMIFGTAAEKVTLPDWLINIVEAAPEEPERPQPTPTPKDGTRVPYAPVPGRDDRTPIDYLSHVFELDDPSLPEKMSGVGPVFWKHAGRGTGAMISPEVVLTTAHLFAQNGNWKGPVGLSPKPPNPSDGRIWLEACGRSYDFASVELGSLAPRSNLGVDYAIATLTQPVCPEAAILPVSLGPENIGAGNENQIFIDLGFYAFMEIARYANHPLFTGRAAHADGMQRLALFGTRCEATQNQATQPVPDGSTGLIISKGCFGRPGSSGGPAVLSRDGGVTYSIVGVSNSYRKSDPEYNNYTRIEGALATHIARYVDLVELSDVIGPSERMSPAEPVTGPWLPTQNQIEETSQ